MVISGNEGERAKNRIFGVVIGIVSSNQDPDNLGRVKVKFPWLADSDESHWARIAQPMTGKDRGTWIIPEVDDEVLVAFEHGDIRFPYVVGSLWNGQDTPPAEKDTSGKNDKRFIKSRSGHIIMLNDASGSEEVQIVTHQQKSKVTLKSNGDITIEGMNINLKADQDIKLEGTNISIKANAQMEVKAGASGKVEASGPLSVKGAVVNIN